MATTTSTGNAIAQDLQTLLRAVDWVETADHRKIKDSAILIAALPVSNELIKTLPAIRIARRGKVESRPADFEGSVDRGYTFEVCIIEATEGNYGSDGDDLAIHETWHEQAIKAIQKDGDFIRTTLPNVPTVWQIEIEEAPTVDRSKLNDNYSYQSVIVMVATCE